MPATGLKNIDTGATNAWKSKKFWKEFIEIVEKILLGEHLATN